MNQTNSTVISYGSTESGSDKAYLRIVEEDSDLVLPCVPMGKEHRSFVLATWVKSYAPVLRKKWPSSLDGQKRLLEEEASSAEAMATNRTVIVTSAEDNFTIHAWCCGSPGQLDYVYVPPELRNKGIASALIRHVCGHTYEYGRPWPFKKGPNGGSYNPYILGRRPVP